MISFWVNFYVCLFTTRYITRRRLKTNVITRNDLDSDPFESVDDSDSDDEDDEKMEGDREDQIPIEIIVSQKNKKNTPKAKVV